MQLECRSHLFPCHAIHAKLWQATASQELLQEKEAAESSMGAEVTCFTEVAYRFFVTWLDSKYSRYA